MAGGLGTCSGWVGGHAGGHSGGYCVIQAGGGSGVAGAVVSKKAGSMNGTH